MTHQVIFLSKALRANTAEAIAPFSTGTSNNAAAPQTATPVGLSVALRYLASRRRLLRTAADVPVHD